MAHSCELNHFHLLLYHCTLSHQHRQHCRLQRHALPLDCRPTVHVSDLRRLRHAQALPQGTPSCITLDTRQVRAPRQYPRSPVCDLVFLLEFLAQQLRCQCRQLQLGLCAVRRLDGSFRPAVLCSCQEGLRGTCRQGRRTKVQLDFSADWIGLD